MSTGRRAAGTRWCTWEAAPVPGLGVLPPLLFLTGPSSLSHPPSDVFSEFAGYDLLAQS